MIHLPYEGKFHPEDKMPVSFSSRVIIKEKEINCASEHLGMNHSE